MNDDNIWIAAFDIGKCNFSFCIEEVTVSHFQHLETIPKSRRYHRDGTCTDEFDVIIKQVCASGRIVLLENLDLTSGSNKKKYLDPIIFITMNRTLDQYREYWDKCSVFLVEQQMSFGKNRNTMALKLGQHCLSYFLFYYDTFKQAIEFPAYHKTQVLGGPKKITKYQRKKWAVARMKEMLENRGDKETLALVNSLKKADDVSDTALMIQAYKFMEYVED